MRVLLTGANGFVGSHVLDRLVEAGHQVVAFLRRTSDTRFIEPNLPRVEVRYGSLESVESLCQAARDAEAVVHCGAKTKAVRRNEYYQVNGEGTRRVVAACNAARGAVKQLILVSSLAVSGPGTAECPAREDAPPRPVSVYGRSKLLAETYVRTESRVPYTILRPAAVYGPRDRDLYLAFRAVRRRLMPLIAGGRQPLNLIYAADVAEAVSKAVGCTRSYGGIYHLAHPVPWTQRAFLARIAAAMGVRPRRVAVPVAVLYPVCAARELWSRITSRPSMLNLQKIAEYTAPGWVCTTARAAEDLGFAAATSLDEGIGLTVRWYEDNGWL